MSQFVREQELEDPNTPPNWIEKGRTEICVNRNSPIYEKSVLFEATNHERLLFKVVIYAI